MVKDIIHDAVKNALIKDGWTIIADPFQVKYEELEVFADLAAERSPIAAERNGRKILVEIKSFVGHSFVRDLQQALGQWLVYEGLIDIVAPGYELFIVISDWVYYKHFTKKATQYLMQRHQVGLIVVDIKKEEIVTWINSSATKQS